VHPPWGCKAWSLPMRGASQELIEKHWSNGRQGLPLRRIVYGLVAMTESKKGEIFVFSLQVKCFKLNRSLLNFLKYG